MLNSLNLTSMDSVWKGVSLNDIHRNVSSFDFDHMGRIPARQRKHEVLHQLPWLEGANGAPAPLGKVKAYAAEYVKMPYEVDVQCSSRANLNVSGF